VKENINIIKQPAQGKKTDSSFKKDEPPLFFCPTIQTKLAVNQPGDPYEKEADSMAEKVMRMEEPGSSRYDNKSFFKPSNYLLQKQHPQEDEPDKEIVHRKEMSNIHRKCAECEEENTVHRKEVLGSEEIKDHQLDNYISSLHTGGYPLPESTRNFFEPRFNQNFSNVRVHSDNEAAQSAQSINALAYTSGNNIVFGRHQFSPETAEGKKLLGHELTHVVQQGPVAQETSNDVPEIVQRQVANTSASPTNIHVPPSDNITEWTPPVGKEFQWQNDDLRKIIYPEREQSLRAFLEMVKKFELEGILQNPTVVSDDELSNLLESDKSKINSKIESLTNEKSDLQEEIKTAKDNLTNNEDRRKQAEINMKGLLKPGTDTAKIYSTKQNIEKSISDSMTKIEKAQKDLNDLRIRKTKLSDQEFNRQKVILEKRKQDALEERKSFINDQESNQVQYNQLIEPTETESIITKNDFVNNKQIIKTSEARIVAIDKSISQSNSDLIKVNKLIAIMEKRKGSPKKDFAEKDERDIKTWSLNRYRAEISEMQQNDLLKELLEVFKQFKTTGFFPDWMEYALIHFAGMRYATAHGTWDESPQYLLTVIKNLEINEADEDKIKILTGEAAHDLSKDEQKKIDGIWNGAKKRLAKDDMPAYEKLKPLTGELMQKFYELSKLENNSDPFKELMEKIASLENQIENLQAEFSEAGWKNIQITRDDEKNFLLELYRQKTKKQLLKLSTPKALAVLTEMHKEHQIPDFAWKEIASFTELKLEIDSKDFVEKDDKGLKKVTVTPDIDIEEFTKWKIILKQWYKASDGTAWRSEQAKTLSVSIVTSLVCDQISSVIQHSRGLEPAGGLRKNAMFYYNEAKKIKGAKTPDKMDKKALCPTEPGTAVFKRPSVLEDFPCGASIFWADWSDLGITKEYGSFYDKSEKPISQEIKILTEKRNNLLKSDIKKDLPKIEIKLADLNEKRKKMLVEKSKLTIFQPQDNATDKEKFIPDNSNIVSPFPESELKLFDTDNPYTEKNANGRTIADFTESSFEIKDKLTKNGWTYSFDQNRIQIKGDSGRIDKLESIMRVMPNPNVGVCPDGEKSCPLEFTNVPNPKLIKQWLVWKHQATVMFVIPSQNKIVTFDTSGSFNDVPIRGLTPRERTLDSMIGNKNIFVGFSPGKSKDLTPFLEEDKVLTENSKSESEITQPEQYK
jgi:Domain of unknown function (DUF4157)